jgi:cytochrome c oxidase subunit 2
MTFSDSIELLQFHWVVYSIYALLIISIIAWFGFNLTKEKKITPLIRVPFYGYMTFLIIAGVGHHIFTYNAIPWVSEDITRHKATPDKIFKIKVGKNEITRKQEFILPSNPMIIDCNDKVLFDVESKDLTYGFGLFRKDYTMVTQMQVNPGTKNDLLWTFGRNGTYTILSTEYSGPAGTKIEMKDAVIVQGCGSSDNSGKKLGGIQ